MNPRTSVKSLIEAWLETERPVRIGPDEFTRLQREISARLGPNRRLAPRYLIEVLLLMEVDRAVGGIPVDLRGRVGFSDERETRTSLLEMAAEHVAAQQAGREGRMQDCRQAVLLAKDRLKVILANKNLDEQKRRDKEEFLNWFIVWLENPSVFPEWLELRRKQLAVGR